MSQQLLEKTPAVELEAPKPQPIQPEQKPTQDKGHRLRTMLLGPIGLTLMVFFMFVGLMGYGFTVLVNAGLKSSQSTGTTSSTATRMQMDPTTTAENVPNATQNYGAQPAQYTLASDGAKVFHFTAEQVMWEPVHGHP